jgi:tetratricopeptide (TPR) repeat protein
MRTKDLDSFEPESLPEIQALRRQPGCPPFRHLYAARVQSLPEELQSTVDRHVATCKVCASIQADADALPTLPELTQNENRRIFSRVRRASRSGEGSRSALTWIFSWRAAFATLAAVVCAVLLVQQARRTVPAGSQTAAVSRHEPAMQAHETLKLEKADVKLTLSILTWRGTGGDSQQFLADLGPALDAYRADRFADAARQLETLSGRYPASVETFFYLGVSRLFLGDHDSAIKALEKADGLASDSFSADVSWYLALAYFKSGRIADARSRLSSLAAGSSPYAARARTAFEALEPPASPR